MSTPLTNRISASLTRGNTAFAAAARTLDAYGRARRLEGRELYASALATFDRLYSSTRNDALRFKRLHCYLPLGLPGDFEREAESLTRRFGKTAAAYAALVALESSDRDRALAWLNRMSRPASAPEPVRS